MISNHPKLETTQLLDRLDLCPPFAVYYASHIVTGTRLTLDELTEKSGLTRRTFLRTSRKTTWAGVKVEVMVRFCRACSVDPLNAEEVLEKLALEMQSPDALKAWDGHARGKMIANFNMLAAVAAMRKAA